MHNKSTIRVNTMDGLTKETIHWLNFLLDTYLFDIIILFYWWTDINLIIILYPYKFHSRRLGNLNELINSGSKG